ncbi:MULTISPECIES: hypothetical protein [Klebsiella]|jgi:hypothetical protein|nr:MULTISPECIES: hypothetical protein [Klebsiella]QBL52284.1 hypothetical protein BMD99_027965 [Klebsiella sp. PO552]QLT68301.1 hypothetical protein HV202_31550 [Klebsiella oxytoca]HCA4366094.1 hypothetical protein [Klebsiella variicola subsp. variicola]HCI6033123.1 hypothetical protein [Klebsiella quasipneumoniae subsp. quasipneumoniae]EIW8528374.1 hypothetical protein [Klebsiella pneumoniae]
MSEVKKVITVAERSTKALVKVVADSQKVLAELASMADSNVILAEEIEFKQGQLADIENQIASTEREAKAQLRLRVIENEDKVLADLMKARGYAVITFSDLDSLNSDLVAAKTDNDFAVSEAREAGYQAAAAKFGAENRELASQHKVELAEFKAQAVAKNQRISDLEAQVSELRGQITAERETRLEIAKADAGRAGVVVNAGKN